MLNKNIRDLVAYGMKTGLVPACEKNYTTNLLLDLFHEDEYEEPVEELVCEELELILKELLDEAVKRGIIEDSIGYRDLFDTKIMNCLMPRPAQVQETFWKKYEESPQTATDYFYKLSQDSDYIRRYRIKKDRKWTVDSAYGTIDITINLSKPEKDPKAIAAAKNGNADLILVHSKSQEEAFVEEGFGRVLEGFETERLSFLYNYFVLCGPSADPAGVKEAASVLDAFKAIADGKYTFISRGDGSGTHRKELALWPEEMGITAEAESFADYTEWYVSANTGMGACLVMAEEMGAYILTDKATFLTFVANNGVM